MRVFAAGLLICLALGTGTTSSALRRESCSCTADDGSCSASISCPGGCFAICPHAGCRAVCLHQEDYTELDPQPTPTPTRRGRRGRKPSEQESSAEPDDLFIPAGLRYFREAEVKSGSSGDIYEARAAAGAPRAGGEDPVRLQTVGRALTNGERVAACFRGVPAGRLARELSSLTGFEIKVEPEATGAIINYKGKGVTFEEIVAQVSKQSGVRFSVR